MRHMAVSMVTKTPVRPIPALGGEEQRLRFAQAAFLAAQLSSSPGPTFTQTELSSPAFKGPEHTCRVPSNWLTKPLLRESEARRLNPRPAPISFTSILQVSCLRAGARGRDSPLQLCAALKGLCFPKFHTS